MRTPVGFRFILILTLIATTFTGCSRDPNVRKQKYLTAASATSRKGSIVKPRSSLPTRSRSIRVLLRLTINWPGLSSRFRSKAGLIRNSSVRSSCSPRITRPETKWLSC